MREMMKKITIKVSIALAIMCLLYPFTIGAFLTILYLLGVGR